MYKLVSRLKGIIGRGFSGYGIKRIKKFSIVQHILKVNFYSLTQLAKFNIQHRYVIFYCKGDVDIDKQFDQIFQFPVAGSDFPCH